MPFPLSELQVGGTFAFIITLDNQLRVYRVTPIYGRIFYVPDLGFFLLDEEYRYILTNGKCEIYIYNQKGCNPLSAASVNEIKRHLVNEGKKHLDMKDLALYVDKIRKVEVGKSIIQRLKSDPNHVITDEELSAVLHDASFDFTVEKLTELSRPRSNAKLSEQAISWLNSYFKEDVVSRHYLLMREITDTKYKMKESKRVTGALSYFGPTAGKKNIALIVINNSRIEVDTKVKVEMNYEKGFYELATRKYGIFEIREAKTRYKFGRQNVFVVMVDTANMIPASLSEKLPVEPRQEQEAPMPEQMLVTAGGDQQALAGPRKRGRPRKGQDAIGSTTEGSTT